MVYVVTDGSGYAKIGVATNVDARVKELQCGNPRTIRIIKTIELEDDNDYRLEHSLHKRYEHARVATGGTKSEWFNVDGISEIVKATREETKLIAWECGVSGRVTVKKYSDKFETPISVLREQGLLPIRTLIKIKDHGIQTVEELKELIEENKDYIGFGIPGIGEQREQYIVDAIKQYDASPRDDKCMVYDFRTKNGCECVLFPTLQCKKGDK